MKTQSNNVYSRGRACPYYMRAIPAVVLILLFGALFMVSPAHAASGAGQISGQLQDGTNHSAAVGGQQVTLQVAQGTNAQDLTTVTTDAQGMYMFPNLDTDKTKSYAIYAHYQGAQYVSSLVTLDSNPTQQLNLTVYQSTQSSAKIAITDATALIHEPSLQKSTITISEVFTFENLDTHTYVGSLDGSKGKPNALFFSLPLHAKNVSVGQSFNGYHVIQVDRGFASDTAVPPGASQFSFSFDVPYSSTTYDLAYTTMYPTVSLSLLVPPDLHTSSSALKAQGLVNSGADEHAYALFKSDLLPAQKSITVHLEGLIVLQAASSNTLDAGTIWIVVGVLLILAMLLVTWFLFRRRQSSARRRKGTISTTKSATKASKTQPVSKDSTVHVPTKGVAASSERQQQLLQQLLDLDKAYESGQLTKAVYEERRGKTKARLRTLMSEQETSRR